MSIYAVGDIQGCLEPLKKLLEQVNFDPAQDQLWSVGDMVNRGPQSLDTLRFLKSLGNACISVLGNHDLHLLAVAYGIKQPKKSDTLQEILDAPDCQELLTWLEQKPLLHTTEDKALVHAGIPHIWTVEQASAFSKEVSQMLNSEQRQNFLQEMYGNEPALWSEYLSGMERLRVITNYLTRMRVCDSKGTLELGFKSFPEQAPNGYSPWFTHYSKPSHHIFFGHWAALETKTYNSFFHALDSGCVWGNRMTMIDVDTRQRFYHRD